jgi:hypothetical protein
LAECKGIIIRRGMKPASGACPSAWRQKGDENQAELSLCPLGFLQGLPLPLFNVDVI